MKPIPANPYIVGNPIKTKEMFFGREDDFYFVTRKIGVDKANQVIIFCGERRSGKTSILFQILSGKLGEHFLPILVDMQILAGLKTDMEFFRAILEAGCDQLRIPGLNYAEVQKRAQQLTVERILETFLSMLDSSSPGKVVLFLLDEYELLEAKIKEGSLSESVIHYLAGVLESKYRISFIFTGSTNLENRKVDFWKILLGKSIYRKISYLSQHDTERLITEPLLDCIDYPDGVIESIYRFTGGQPFYTQVICQNLVDILIEEQRSDPAPGDLEKVVKDIIENPLPQMIYSWNSLGDWTKFALSSLAGKLEGGKERVDASGIYQYLVKNKIALPFKRERLNVFLEEAYEKEFLEKTDAGGYSFAAGYSFRMDLYRRWIRKEHSVWKVIKEVNLEVKKARRAALSFVISAASLLVVAAGLFFILDPFDLRATMGLVSPDNNVNGIRIVSNQPGIRVSIDGTITLTNEGQQDEKSVMLPALEPGKHAFVFINTRTGEKLEREIEVTDEMTEIPVMFTQEAGTATVQQIGMGSLFLSTTPENARIVIDGVFYDYTPRIIPSLKVGEHRVVLEREGYRSSVFSVNVSQGINERKTALVPVYGSLVLDVRPTAKIYLDGTYLVDTPYAQGLKVQAGRHVLTIVNESLGVKEDIPIVVRENEEKKIERILK